MNAQKGFMQMLERELVTFREQFDGAELPPQMAMAHEALPEFICGETGEVDFRAEAGLKRGDARLAMRHLLVTCTEKVMETVQRLRLGICCRHNTAYLYNGAYWQPVEQRMLEAFLGNAAERMGLDRFTARHYLFREQLLKQFLTTAPPPPARRGDSVLINLLNGTFEIDKEHMALRKPHREDFLTYRLPFAYDEGEVCPRFDAYLERVLPEPGRRLILLEYLGYLFVRPSQLKLEKALILYGSGANGKSVLFEIVNALLGGNDNVSHFSLQNLTNENGYYRAMLGGKLVNYASEMNGKLDTAIFKQLVSGEPVDARLPYGEPFTLSHYGKLIFNCNELPRMVEHTHAFFRRFLIIPFEVTIPEEEQDSSLAQKIIDSELPGVLNRVLEGLRRLLRQRGFTTSEGGAQMLQSYREESNSVALFLEEEQLVPSMDRHITVAELYTAYRTYCLESGCYAVTKRHFTNRLRDMGIVIERKAPGMAVRLQKKRAGIATAATPATSAASAASATSASSAASAASASSAISAALASSASSAASAASAASASSAASTASDG